MNLLISVAFSCQKNVFLATLKVTALKPIQKELESVGLRK